MRLKTMDGPVAISNGNNILNSPKRINTTQSSNILTDNYTTNFTNSTGIFNKTANHFDLTTENLTNSALNYCTENSNNTINDVITTLQIENAEHLNIFNAVQDKVQWCKASLQEVQKDANNCKRNLVNVNINNTLAATFGHRQRQAVPPAFLNNTANSIYSEQPTPDGDDTFLSVEAQQSCFSTDISPQDEDRCFDISDSESSEDGNLSNQDLAHTLTSDDEYTDGELDFEAPNLCNSIAAKIEAEANNNNNTEDTATDHKIDSVNRLNSIENIQKVFYDKPVFNIKDDSECNQTIDCNTSILNQSHQSDYATNTEENLNIRIEEPDVTTNELAEHDLNNFCEEPNRLTKLAKGTINELNETVEKLHIINDFVPTPIKCNIKTNPEQPLNKLCSVGNSTLHQILDDSKIINKSEDGRSVAVMKSVDLIPNEENLSSPDDSPISREPIAPPLSICLKNCQTAIIRKILLDSETPFVDLDLIPDKESVKGQDSPDLIPDEKINNSLEIKIEDAFLSNGKENINITGYKESILRDSNLNFHTDKVEPRKEVKKRKDYNQKTGSLITFPKKDSTQSRNTRNRRSLPIGREKKNKNPEAFDTFDVYNIETAMPQIDLEAIESHLRAAKEKERRRHTDREEIRRQLAMGSDIDYYADRPGRKPSLQSRLQSGMNLQICFMNETLSDTDSPNSDSETPATNSKQHKLNNNLSKSPTKVEKKVTAPPTRPVTLSLGQQHSQAIKEPAQEMDFFARQARLQTEARMALAQAKEMARMQMEIEKQRQKKSPITEMIRTSMEKVGIPFPEEKRRLSRQILTDMNVAQLQVIVNDLHTQIEGLNEALVKFLMTRDDLHMEQDSMLVDIEDLTRYLGAKEQVIKDQNVAPIKNNNIPPSPAPSSPLQTLNSTVKPHLNRIANLVKK